MKKNFLFPFRYWLIVPLLITMIFNSQAQVSNLVTGSVSEQNDKSPLPGVVVTNLTTKQSVSTNSEGKYTIRAAKGTILSFSFIGYETQEQKVEASVLNVTLDVKQKGLDEVIVVGYGTTSKRNLTTAVSKVDPKNIPQAANSSVAQLLFGRAAGLTATQNSSEPGGNITVSIRGRGNPLVVVDGVIYPYDGLEPGSGNATLSGNVNRGGFAGINPEDIESIEFLKDASAAIYGVNAANGVMLITTKKGKAGRMNINYDGSHSFVSNAPYLEPLNATQYETTYNQLTLDYFLLNNKMAPYGPNPVDLTAYYGGANKPFTQDQISKAGVGTNWLSYLLKNGSIDNQNLSISGASDKVTYYFSGGLFDQKGSEQHSDLKRYSSRLNLTFELSKFLSLTANVNGSRNDFQNPQSGYQGNARGQQGFTALQAAVAYPAYLPLRDPVTGNYSQFGQTGNPISLLDIQDNTENNSLFASFAADFKIIPKMLTARILYGDNTETTDRNTFIPSTVFFDLLNQARGYVTNSRRENQTMEATVNFKKSFGEIVNIDAVVGTGQYPNSYYTFTASGADMLDAIGTDNLGASSSSSQTVSSSRSANKLRSYFGRTSFDILDRYLVTLTERYDGYSQFFPQNKYASFPAASLGWKLSNEKFMHNINVINFLKIRASIGVTGDASGYAYGTFSPGVDLTSFNNGATTYYPYYLSALDNPNLKWPKTINKNIGLDFGFFKDRINGSVDWFRDDLTRFVVYQTTNPLSFLSTAPINTGHQVRQGWELNLNTVNLKSPNFSWTSLINLSHNTLRWQERFANTVLSAWQNPQDLVSSYYVLKTNGIIKDANSVPASQPAGAKLPGDPIFVDQNHDGKIDASDIVRIDPSVKLSIGFGNTFSYKSFDLNFLFYGQFGGKGYNNVTNWLNPLNIINGFQSSIQQINQVWTTSNPNGTRPGVAYNESALGLPTGTDLGVISTNFVRCRNITLGYNFNSVKVAKYVRNLRVFVDAQNPFIITKYPISDPELDAAGVGGGPAPYPMTRTFSVGVKANF